MTSVADLPPTVISGVPSAAAMATVEFGMVGINTGIEEWLFEAVALVT